MTINELKELALSAIDKLKNSGIFPKENNLFDFKAELNYFGISDGIEIFIRNFGKDILSFSNGIGGIILLGIKEDESTGNYQDIGLSESDLELLQKIDLNKITQKFEKIIKVGVGVDLQKFQSGTRLFYYLLIEKQNQTLVPTADFPDYKIKKGEIYYRASSKTETANNTTQDFNRFLQIKANEKNKEFMAIWSKLLPEIFDINPREVLIINPKYNQIYGYNGKDNILSSSEIEIDKSESGVFNIILNAIAAGDIGKISDTEGKPLYKIVGEINASAPRDYILISTLHAEVRTRTKYKISNLQLKALLKHLGWVSDENFKVENPTSDPTSSAFSDFIWLENFDKIKQSHKVVCSEKAIETIVNELENSEIHIRVFGKVLAKESKNA